MEGLGERQLCWCVAAPVRDPRHEDVHGDEEKEEIRDGEANYPCDEPPGSDDLAGHAPEGPATLCQVDDHQPDEHEANVRVDGDPHVQKLKSADCGRGCRQQTEMDDPTRSGAPRRPAVGLGLERHHGLGLERSSTILYLPAPATRGCRSSRDLAPWVGHLDMGYSIDSGARLSGVPLGMPVITFQAARRRTNQTVTAISSTDKASSQPPSIHWNGQNRLAGW